MVIARIQFADPFGGPWILNYLYNVTRTPIDESFWLESDVLSPFTLLDFRSGLNVDIIYIVFL